MAVQVFFIGLIFSFVGSIPPGTLNILVLQLGLENKVRTALRFALAVAIIEYPYAWIAVAFENWLSKSTGILENFELTGALLMTILGLLSLWTARKPTSFAVKFQESGFRRGLVLSILNPQAIPFWIAATAYLRGEGWIDLSTGARVHSYVLGTSVGAMLLLSIVAILAQRVSSFFQASRVLRVLPGVALLCLGLIGFLRYFAMGKG